MHWKYFIPGICLISFSVGLYGQNGNEELSRKILVKNAVDNSYTLKNRKAELEKDRLDKKKLYQTYLPNVSLNSTYMQLDDDIQFGVPPITLELAPGVSKTIVIPPMILQESEIWKADISASMVLFSGLKVPLTLKALKHRENANRELIRIDEALVIKETVDYYDRLALIDQSLKVLDDSKARLDEENAFANKAFKQGLISAYDLSKIDIAIQELEAKRIDLAAKRSLTLSKLRQLTGYDISPESLHPVLSIWKLQSGETEMSQVPEAKALAEVVAVRSVSQDLALTSYMPGIYAFSKKELRTEDLSALDPQGYIGIGLKWSLFDGMQGARDYQKACIERQIAENNYNDAISLLNLQVEKCKSELDVAYQLISVAEKKKITAAKGLQIATRQYELGLGSITERLIAETDLQTAQLEYLQAVYNQRMAVLALLRVQGKLTPDVINE